MLDALFNVLDLPGSSVRDLIAGENPFDQWTSPFNSDHRTSGSRLVSMYTGANPNSLGATIAGIGAEMLLDPTNLIGGAGLLKRMIGARRAMRANATAEGLDAARYSFVNPKVFSRAAGAAEDVVSAGSPLRPGKYASFEDAVGSLADEYETYFEDPDFAYMLRTGPWGDATSQVPGAHAARQFDATGTLAVQYEPNGMWDVFDSSTAYETGILNPKPVAGLLPYYDDKMTLHHASPALWAAEPGFPYGRPNLKYMNTGEKNQAFGPGFYAAENPEVVDTYYMNTLAKEGYDPAKIEALLSAHEDAVNLVANALKDPRYAPMHGTIHDIIEAVIGVAPVEGVYNVMKDSLFNEEVNPIISDLISGFKGSYLIPRNVDDLQLSNSVLQDVLSNLGHENEFIRFGLSRGASLDDVNLLHDFAGIASKTVGSLGDVEWDMRKSFQIIPPNRYTLSMPKEEWNRLLKSENFMDDDPRTREIMDDVWLAISKASNGMPESQLDDIIAQFETANNTSALGWLRDEIPGIQGKSGQPFPEYGSLKPGEFWDEATEKALELESAKLFDRSGIPGFKYWDGFSRSVAGDVEDTRNVVIWNQDVLNQIKPRIINGVPVPLNDMLPIQKLASRGRRIIADDEFLIPGSPLSPSRPRTPVPTYAREAAELGLYNGLRITTHE